MVVRPPPWFARLLIDLGLAEVATPATPTCTITFHAAPNSGVSSPMATPLVGTITPGPADTAVPVAKREVIVTLNGAALPALDAINGPVTFPCNPGDSGHYELTDISAGGVRSQSFLATFVAHDSVTPPATPTAAISFAPAPAAA